MSDEAKRIHLVAICGVGMAPLAVMLKAAGNVITGSDKAAFPPMSDVLRAAGIDIMEGFAAEHLHPRPDLVIVGNAVPRTNPEAVEAERLGLLRMSFPQAVSGFFLEGNQPLVVAGTHGKTTTTGMLAHALQVAGLHPGYLVGGLVRDLGNFAQPGSGGFFVIEGDEYDSAFFDKRPKFLHYRPAAAIITSVEFDHADIYRDLQHVKAAFRDLATLVPPGAPLVTCSDYPAALDVARSASLARIVTYGLEAQTGWQPTVVGTGASGARVRISWRGRAEDELLVGVAGRMNALNATAVYALCRELNVPTDAVREALASYRGPARRQEVVGDEAGITVIDDFAHHPTAVAETLAAVRSRFPGRRLVAVFEPRSNTSRRAIFQDEYAKALTAADAVVVSRVFAKDNDPLAVDEMLSTDRLVTDLRRAGTAAAVGDGPDAILARLTGETYDGDVVVCMSNGAFGNLPRRLLSLLAARRDARVSV